MPDYRKTHYRVDVRDVKREIDRVDGLPNQRNILAFEAILEHLYQQTKLDVHAEGYSPSGKYLRTGSLRASGKRWSDYKDHKWRGRITYGGRVDGFPGNHGEAHNPVKYAIYEEERGGEHDFMRSNRDVNNAFLRSMRDALAGD